jgi:hypothetical protein
MLQVTQEYLWHSIAYFMLKFSVFLGGKSYICYGKPHWCVVAIRKTNISRDV